MPAKTARYASLSRPTLPPHRLETDLQPVPGRLGEAPERARRGQAAAAFQPRDRALRRLHALGEFGLAQARPRARFRHLGDERELLLQRVVLLAHLRVLQQPRLEVLEFRHVISLARWQVNIAKMR